MAQSSLYFTGPDRWWRIAWIWALPVNDLFLILLLIYFCGEIGNVFICLYRGPHNIKKMLLNLKHLS